VTKERPIRSPSSLSSIISVGVWGCSLSVPSALQSVYTRIASYWEMEPAGTGGACYHRVQIIDILFHVKSAVNLQYHLVVFQPHTTTQTIRAPDRSPAASLVLPPVVGVEWCGRCVWLCARAHGSRVPSTSVVWTWFTCDVLLSMIGVPSAHTLVFVPVLVWFFVPGLKHCGGRRYVFFTLPVLSSSASHVIVSHVIYHSALPTCIRPHGISPFFHRLPSPSVSLVEVSRLFAILLFGCAQSHTLGVRLFSRADVSVVPCFMQVKKRGRRCQRKICTPSKFNSFNPALSRCATPRAPLTDRLLLRRSGQFVVVNSLA
jgi:hypothetical protein